MPNELCSVTTGRQQYLNTVDRLVGFMFYPNCHDGADTAVWKTPHVVRMDLFDIDRLMGQSGSC